MKRQLLANKIFLLLLAILTGHVASAQLDSCNIFLKGKYVEVGINVNGAYGSSVNAPAGYHPKGPATEYNTCYNKCTSGGNLGFVADPDKDGWTTGTPTYFGDYFLPGYPQEGWSIMADGTQVDAWNGGGICATLASTYPFSSTSLTGSNITYGTTGSQHFGIWQGSYDSLQITQTTKLDTTKVFFTIYVSIVNKSATTKRNVYYLRTVDPDNDEPEVGSTGFETINRIDYKLPNSLGASLVSATSETYSRCYLGLGTLDCRAKTFIKKSGLTPNTGTLDSMYGKHSGLGDTANYIYTDSLVADVCINLVYKLGDIAPGDSVNIAYTYILNKSDITAAFQSITPQWMADTTPHLSGDTITSCRNTTSHLSIINGGAYTWTWSSLTGDSLSATSGTSVYVTTDTASVSYIRAIGTSVCQNDTIIMRIAGPPRVRIDSVAPICSGSTVKLKAHGATSYTWSPSTGLSCTNCDSTNASPTSTTTYKVVGTNSYGCKDSTTRTVTVHPLPTITNTSNQTICSGDSVKLVAHGARSYVWSPVSGLSCSNCDSTFAHPGSTTTYTITGTDSNGCVNKDSVTVTVNAAPTVNAGPDKTICKGSSASLSATGASSYSWSPTTGLSCSACANPTASPDTTTKYVVTGTGSNGCTKTDTVIVKVNPLPTVTAGTDKTICNGSSVILSVTGASSYSWSPTTGLSCATCSNPTASPTSTTTYVVTGTDTNACINKDTVVVNVNPLPAVNAGADKTICRGSSVTLTATGASSYSWTPTSGLSCATCASPTASPTSTTTYVVTGTDANGCINRDTVAVNVHPLPAINAGADKAICIGNSATLTATGATSYSWSPGTGLSCTTCASPTATPTSTTTYIVTGTDSNSCSNKDTVIVKVNALPAVNAGPDKTICSGSSATLSASGASSYSWTPTSGLSCSGCASPTATPTSTTTYVVTGTDSNSCTNKDTVIVKVNALPAISAGADKAICSGSSAALSATGGSSYSWTPATGLSCTGCANPTATPTSTTTYIVTGTDSNSCTNKDTVIVKVNPLPHVNAGPDRTTCAGTVSLSATGAASYSWSPATGLSCTSCANPTASLTGTSTYVVTGTDSNGCVNKDTVTVNISSLPTVSAGPDKTICHGDSTILSGSGAATYTWSPSTRLSCTTCASPTASPVSTTSYVITGTDSNGCSGKDTVLVTVNPLPAVSAGPDRALCAGSGPVSLYATGATSYTWTPATGLSCTTCDTAIASPTSSTTYVLTGTDANGCVNRDTVAVVIRPLPSVNAGPDQSVCKGNAITLSASGASTYSWGPATGLSCTTCARPTVTAATTTAYVVTGTDSYGCTNKDTVTITVKPLPVLTHSPDQIICAGKSATLAVAGAATYRWSPATGLSCTTCDTLTATPGKTTKYIVTGTDSAGCADTANILVTVDPLPIVNVTHDTTICDSTSVRLAASGAFSYTWAPPKNLSCTNCAATIASPTDSTTYVVVGTDENGCKNANHVTVNVIYKQSAAVSLGDTICKGQTASLSALGGTAYTWIPASGLSNDHIPNPIATPDSTTTYTVIIQQGICFTDTDHVTVVVNPVPELTVTGDQSIYEGETAHLHATGNNIITYEWVPDPTLSCTNCSDPLATPGKTTTYTVSVTAQGGCKAQSDITVTVKCGTAHVFIPNTFTPNGDGLNDRFYPSGTGLAAIKRFSVYDRWGEEVYSIYNIPFDSPSYGWDGTYKGKQLKPDVYVYYIIATCASGETVEMKGDISLIR